MQKIRSNIVAERLAFDYVRATRPSLSLSVLLVTFCVSGFVVRDVYLAQILAYAAFVLCTLVFSIGHLRVAVLGKLKLREFVPIALACIVAGSAYPICSRALVSALCERTSDPHCTSNLLSGSFHPSNVMSLLLAPYVETLLVNGWLQTWLARIQRHLAAASAVVAFVAPHFSLNVWFLIAGTAFAVLRAKTKSLGLIFLMHVSANAAFTLLFR